MIKFFNLMLCLLLPILCMEIGCDRYSSKARSDRSKTLEFKSTADIKYAKGFTISKYSGYRLLEVAEAYKGSGKAYKYLLIPKGSSPPSNVHADITIETPVSNIIVTSTNHLPALELLGVHQSLVGFPNTDLVSSSIIRQRIDQGEVINLGKESQLDLEIVVEIAPDLIIDFAMGNSYDQYEKIKATGIPVLLNADYLEETPLGRAEWIKFVAALFDLGATADSIFGRIETNYLSLKLKGQNQAVQPTVYTGIVYGDIWYMPGGNSYAAEFIVDAGGNYLWSDTKESGSLALSFEQVFAKAHSADYWVGMGSYNSMNEIEAQDQRYRKFSAFQTGQVFNYNAKLGAKGGNTFLELGYARPDMVLADLLHILHPETTPDHQLFFYKKLN